MVESLELISEGYILLVEFGELYLGLLIGLIMLSGILGDL